MKKIILLTGIHGVGKGYISNLIREKIKLPIYEASKLIKQTGNSSDYNKKVKNINKNQELLYMGINSFVKEDIFILDGHTCLLNINGEIEKINLSILRKFNVKGIIFVHDEANSIISRLYNRDRINYEYKVINNFQNFEYENSKKLAEELNIPFLKFKNGENIKKIIDFLEIL